MPMQMPTMMTQFDSRDLRLPADSSRLSEARQFVEEAAAEFGFEEATQHQIKLAINEAVANAMEHGSPGSGDEVELRVVFEERALAIYVSDCGSFTPRTAHREAVPERGRGLAFMDLLMDEVEVRPGADGTRVRMLKRLGD
jgi:anti-sigma regulatory factor (Ser/Thr protein kinase)